MNMSPCVQKQIVYYAAEHNYFLYLGTASYMLRSLTTIIGPSTKYLNKIGTQCNTYIVTICNCAFYPQLNFVLAR